MTLPLAAFPIVSTQDPDEAQSILSGELSRLRFKSIRDRLHFQLDMNGVYLGKTFVAYNRFATETEVDPGNIEDAVIWSFCDGAPSFVQIDDERISPKAACMSSPHRRLKIHRSNGSGVFFVRASYAQIKRRLYELTECRPKEPIVFKPNVDLQMGVGAELRQLVLHFVQDTQGEAGLVHYPLLRNSFDDLLLSTLLALPHNFQTLIHGQKQREVAPAVVLRAEAYLEAHAADAITISDVVAECECNRRSLFDAFRRYRGYTPMQFLSECRLQLVRNALLNACPHVTVTSIALAYGFSHLGRFSAAYRKRYGECPSQTLRKPD